MPEVLGECPDCKEEVIETRTQKAVKCDLCSTWYHTKAKCQNVTDQIYNATHSTQGRLCLYWMCTHCFQPGQTIMSKTAELITTINNYEERLQALENKEKESEEEAKTRARNAAEEATRNYLQENPAENIQQEVIIRSLKEEVKQDIGAGNWPVLPKGDDIELQNRFKIFEQAADERQKAKTKQSLEEEKRKNNIVIYNVKESADVDKEKKVRHDKGEIIRLSTYLGLEGFNEYNMVRVLRMRAKEGGNSRPILVELDSAVTKHKIMRNTYKLGEDEGKKEFESWSIQHDMTEEQRATVRTLVAEARRKETADTSGEYIYRVRGPPHHKYIKKIKKNTAT